ncbi:MAG: hypothetical protein KAI79_17625, partial [Bacteroidales bacterium]|nr:hypothetical protein [Bacteroidales bacterium]
ISFDSQGNLWASSCITGLSMFNGTEWTHEINNIKAFVTSSVYFDELLWVASLQNGVHKLDNSVWTNYTVDDGLADNSVNVLVNDDYNALWIGTGNGLSRFIEGTFTNYSTDDGLISNTITALACDPSGNIWVANNGITKISF